MARPKGGRYPLALRMRVIAEVKAQGEAPTRVAKRYGIALDTVQRWCKEAPDDMDVAMATVQEVDLSKLGPTLVYEMFQALIVHARMAQDEEWLRQHSPAEVAALSGVLADKLFRILDSTAQHDAEEGAEGEGGGHAPESAGVD